MVELGDVIEFDAHVGVGVIQHASGRRYDFHCTSIADGSRLIPVGVRVAFAVAAGGPGRWEAAQVVSLESPSQHG